MRPWAKAAAQGRWASYGAKGLFHDSSRRSWATRRFSPIFGSILKSLAGNLPFWNRPVEPISSRAAARHFLPLLRQSDVPETGQTLSLPYIRLTDNTR